MAGAVISFALEQIPTLLKEQAKYHVNLVRGAEKEVDSIAKELKTVRDVLDDAERRGYKEKSVKAWLSRLEQTFYEMEDVLDEWNYAIRKFQIEGDRYDYAAPMNKVLSFILSCFCCEKIVVRHGIAKKIIVVKEKLDEVLEEKDRYGFAKSQPTADVSRNSCRDPTVGFPKLKKLKFEDCGNWKEWEDITAEEEDSASVTFMPCLTKLVIENCNCLSALPERLLGKKATSLEHVQIGAYNQSASLLIKHYQDREGATWVGREYSRKLQVPFGPK